MFKEEVSMKNKIKVFLLISGVIAVCSAIVCYILRRSENEEENPMFI